MKKPQDQKPEAKPGNHELALARLVAMGQIRPGIHRIVVGHDRWCGYFKGRRCDCSPEIHVIDAAVPQAALKRVLN